MNICILTTPTNKVYGFDGVSDEEFSIYLQNVNRILAKTSMGFDFEFAQGTTDSCDVWSDSDDWTHCYGIGGIRFEPLEEDDEIIHMGEAFYGLQCKYDFFKEMSPKTIAEIASAFQAEIDKYDTVESEAA